MTLQEINEAIEKWREETGGTFILLAVEEGKKPLCHYAGKGCSLGGLIGAAIAEDTDFKNFVMMAQMAVAIRKADKQQCGLTN